MKQEKNSFWRIGAAALLATFLTSSVVLAAPAVKRVRTSQTKHTIRVVADLTEKIPFDAYWQENENDYIVRLNGVGAGASLAAVKHPLLAKAEVIRGMDGALYFVFDMKEKMTAKTFIVNEPTRLVIDFTKEGEAPAVFAKPDEQTTESDKTTVPAKSAAVQTGLVDVTNVRIHHAPDKVRTVFDMDASADYETSYLADTGMLTIRMKNVSAAERTIPAPKAGDVLKRVEIVTSGDDTIVRVELRRNTPCKVFRLTEPHRIVIDALKGDAQPKKASQE